MIEDASSGTSTDTESSKSKQTLTQRDRPHMENVDHRTYDIPMSQTSRKIFSPDLSRTIGHRSCCLGRTRPCCLWKTVLALLVVCCIGGSTVASQAQSNEPAEEIAEFVKFPLTDEEVIYAKVKLFDEEANFAIYTGCWATVLDARFQKRLGKRVGHPTLGFTDDDPALLPFFRSPTMKIVNDDSETAVVIDSVAAGDIESIQSLVGRPIAGEIGMDFLKSYTLRLNPDAHYAALVRTPRNAGNMDGEVLRINCGSEKTMKPSIRLRISDTEFHDIFLDTGAMSTELGLEPALFKRLVKTKRIVEDGGLIVVGLINFAKFQSGILDQVELGNIRLRNVRVHTETENLIGLKFFQRFETDLDFPNRKAYFRPGKRIRGPFSTNLSHFAVKIVNNKLVVVGCCGIAQDAGIRVNDLLVQINGRPAGEMAISEFRCLQCQSDTELNLRFERAGEPVDVSLKLKRPPDPFSDDPPLDFEDLPQDVIELPEK